MSSGGRGPDGHVTDRGVVDSLDGTWCAEIGEKLDTIEDANNRGRWTDEENERDGAHHRDSAAAAPERDPRQRARSNAEPGADGGGGKGSRGGLCQGYGTGAAVVSAANAKRELDVVRESLNKICVELTKADRLLGHDVKTTDGIEGSGALGAAQVAVAEALIAADRAFVWLHEEHCKESPAPKLAPVIDLAEVLSRGIKAQEMPGPAGGAP